MLINPSMFNVAPAKGANCKLLLHCDGTDGSTTFTDSSGLGKTTSSVSGNAQLDTADQRFGTASALFDGTGDRVQWASHADWNIPNGTDFTIDFWFNTTTLSGTQTVCYVAGGGMQIELTASNVLVAKSGVAYRVGTSTTIETGKWNHVALTRSGTNLRIFYNGVLEDTDALNTDNFVQAAMSMGATSTTTNVFNGWIDEFRWVKGTCDWTADFIPPVLAYA